MSKKKKKGELSARMVKEIRKSQLSDEALAALYRTTTERIREVKDELPIR